MTPQISIIMPVYNTESYLEEAIDSVLRQSFIDWELIMVDDGSTDESNKICQAYAKQNERIHLVRIPHSGVSEARNMGIRIATGEWLFFMDSDDIMAPDSLNMLFSASERTDWVIGAYQDYSTKRIHKVLDIARTISFGKDEADTFLLMEKSNAFNRVWGSLYRRSCIRTPFRKDINYGEDILFNFENFKQFQIVSVISSSVYIHRVGYSSMTLSHQSLEQRIFSSYLVTNAILAIYGDNPKIEQYYLSRFILRFYNHCVRLASSGKVETIVELLSADFLRNERIRKANPPLKELNIFWEAVLREDRELVCSIALNGTCFRSDSPGKISVILPVYNMGVTLARSVESIIAQTYNNWELIIVDDGSNDDSSSLMDSYSAKDDRIRVLHISHVGVSNARNIGIEEAVGEWIAFLDGDDIYTPDAFSLMIENSYNADLVMGSYKGTPQQPWERGSLTKMRFCFSELSDDEQMKRLIKGFFFAVVWNKLYRRSLVKPIFDSKIEYGEDTVFNMRSFANFSNFVVLDKITYLYTFNKRKISMKMLKGRLEIVKTALEFYPKNETLKRNCFIAYARLLRQCIAECYLYSETQKEKEERLRICEQYMDFSGLKQCEKYLFEENMVWWNQMKQQKYSEVADGFICHIKNLGMSISDFFGE